ncbi:MAG: thioredoxin [Sandaracinaceae bacterium]|nr:thioredoxin [Myxococcales bacterium]
MPVIPVTDASFEQEVLRSELPVLVDFHADWCQPCKQLSPLVEQVSNELSGKLKVVSVDVDRNPNVAAAFRIQSVPSLFVVHQGQVVTGQPGLVPKEAILEMVRPVLPADAAEIKPDELAQLIAQKRAVPVDIRDARSYGRYRIPTAIHVAKDELNGRAAELSPRDGRIRVLYGRTTDEAKEAADALRELGVETAFLDGGFLHWEADGHEVERPS